jgi:hypothetical protein
MTLPPLPRSAPNLSPTRAMFYGAVAVVVVGVLIGTYQIGRHAALNERMAGPTQVASTDQHPSVGEKQIVSWEPNAEQADGPNKSGDVKRVALAGELYVTIRDNEVKKAPGLTVLLIPVTADLRELMKPIQARLTQIDSDHKTFEKSLRKKYPAPFATTDSFSPHETIAQDDLYRKELAEYERSHADLGLERETSEILQHFKKTAAEIKTDSEGKFRAEVKAGNYLLFSEGFHVSNDTGMWCKAIDASSPNLHLSLDTKSMVYGADLSTLKVFRAIVMQLEVPPKP